MKIIINIYGGEVDAVYTDTVETVEVEVCNQDNCCATAEDKQRNAALQFQMDHGGFRDVLNDVYPMVQEREHAPLPEPHPERLSLISRENMLKGTRGQLQRDFAAFIDGYLSCEAELEYFLVQLHQEGHPSAAVVQEVLKPLMERQKNQYALLCERLNDLNFFTLAGA